MIFIELCTPHFSFVLFVCFLFICLGGGVGGVDFAYLNHVNPWDD
jgi:hypothetical protein